MSRLLEALHSGRVLLMDGAMGTELQRRGLRDGECPELWNLTRPDDVRAVHRAYVQAGAEVLLTNTFQANPPALARYGLQDRLGDIWRAAIANARAEAAGRPVLADVGPIEDFGPEDRRAVRTYCEDADGVLVETHSDPLEVAFFRILWTERKELTDPVLASYSFRHVPRHLQTTVEPDSEDGRTVLRTARDCSPEHCAGQATVDGYLAAVGANCGVEIDLADMLEIVRGYRPMTVLPLFVRPNAGTPRKTDGGWEYPRSPEAMAEKLWPLLEAGVTMVGGCCGTTPAHIAAFKCVVDEWNRTRGL